VVVDAAIALIHDEGYEALTMRSLAGRLGVVPMALYRHVRDKVDLELAVVDRAMTRVGIPDASLDWRTALEQLNAEIRAQLLQLPGIMAPLLARPNIGITAMTLREYSIGVLRRAGFSGRDAERGTALLLISTIGFVALEVPRRAHGYFPDGTSSPDRLAEFAMLPAEHFPHTVELGTDPGEFVSDEQFLFGIRCILDGLQSRLVADGPVG
jgi:TetR/AcrR family tetracycline transcriptional repressor